MFVRPLKPVCRLNIRKYSSDAIPQYHSKVKAIPFSTDVNGTIKLTRDIANIHRIARNEYGPFTVLKRMFDDPIRVEPVFFPLWILEREQSPIKEEDGQSNRSDSILVSPGHSYLPLSMLPYSLSPEDFTQIEDWTPDMATRPDGSYITSLPYTIAPDTPYTELQAQIFNRSRRDPENQFEGHAFPILFPLYLMKWAIIGEDSPHDQLTTISFGNQEVVQCTMFAEDFGDNFLSSVYHQMTPIASPSTHPILKLPLPSDLEAKGLWMYNYSNGPLHWNQYLPFVQIKTANLDEADPDTLRTRLYKMQTLMQSLDRECISWDDDKIKAFPTVKPEEAD